MRTTLVRGLVAGFAGTALMTGYQLAVGRLQGKGDETPVPDSWSEALAPAQVAKKAADAVGQGALFTREDVPWLTDAMHWLYGISWGALYGAARAPVGLSYHLVYGLGVAGAFAALNR